MTLILELPDRNEAILRSRAQANGLSAEEYVEQLLNLELGLEEGESESFWKAFTRRMDSLPDDVFERLPEDAASEHDHYLYGSPRHNS